MSDIRHSRALADATLDAEHGLATCRLCGSSGAFSKYIVLTYGGAVLFVLCLPCAERGNEVLIRRGQAGIEVLRARGGEPLVKPPLIHLAGGVTKRTT